MPRLPEATELEYLRYFFDQVNLTVSERYFIEEGFEMCFNAQVPSSYKMRRSVIDLFPTDPKTPNIPLPPKVPDIEKLLDKVSAESYIVTDKETGENVSLSALINKLKVLSGIK